MNWFNWSAPWMRGLVLWNAFNREAEDAHWWGFGVLQIKQRHFAYIGHQGVCLGFVWLIGSHNGPVIFGRRSDGSA